ncbi:unnamed protein product [Musa textilis]
MFKSSSKVRRIVGSVAETNQNRIRDLPKFSEVRRKDRRRFTELCREGLEACQRLIEHVIQAGSMLGIRRKKSAGSIGGPPKSHRKARRNKT